MDNLPELGRFKNESAIIWPVRWLTDGLALATCNAFFEEPTHDPTRHHQRPCDLPPR